MCQTFTSIYYEAYLEIDLMDFVLKDDIRSVLNSWWILYDIWNSLNMQESWLQRIYDTYSLNLLLHKYEIIYNTPRLSSY